MSDKPSFEVNRAHIPAALLAVLVIPALLTHISLSGIVFLGALILAFFLNKRILYQFFPSSWYICDIKCPPQDWGKPNRGFRNNNNAKEARLVYHILYVGIIGSLASMFIPILVTSIVFGKDHSIFGLMGFLLFFGLYHWALHNYGELLGMASTREKLKADTNEDT